MHTPVVLAVKHVWDHIPVVVGDGPLSVSLDSWCGMPQSNSGENTKLSGARPNRLLENISL